MMKQLRVSGRRASYVGLCVSCVLVCYPSRRPSCVDQVSDLIVKNAVFSYLVPYMCAYIYIYIYICGQSAC